MTKTSFLIGDGRKMLSPINPPENTAPIRVRRAAARRIVENFDRFGISTHSPRGGVLWVVLAHCAEQEIPVTCLSFQGGFVVEKQKGQSE